MSGNVRTSKIDLASRVPKFKSESEEADWWYENREIVEEMFRDAWPELLEKKKSPGCSKFPAVR